MLTVTVVPIRLLASAANRHLLNYSEMLPSTFKFDFGDLQDNGRTDKAMLAAAREVFGLDPLAMLNLQDICATSRLLYISLQASFPDSSRVKALETVNREMTEKLKRSLAKSAEGEAKASLGYGIDGGRLDHERIEMEAAVSRDIAKNVREARDNGQVSKEDEFYLICHTWGIAANYARDIKDYGDLVYIDGSCRRVLLVQTPFRNACPFEEVLARRKAHVMWCLLTYLGFDPLFVAHFTVFREDKNNIKGGPAKFDFNKLCDVRKLMGATAEDAEKYMVSTTCSVQRHSSAFCVRTHGDPPDTKYNGAVHAQNWEPSLPRKAVKMVDAVIARSPKATELVARARKEMKIKDPEALANRLRGSDEKLEGFEEDRKHSKGRRFVGNGVPLIETCDGCSKQRNPLTDPAMKRCSRCKLAKYCDVDCQKADWSAHKALCRKSEHIEA